MKESITMESVSDKPPGRTLVEKTDEQHRLRQALFNLYRNDPRYQRFIEQERRRLGWHPKSATSWKEWSEGHPALSWPPMSTEIVAAFVGNDLRLTSDGKPADWAVAFMASDVMNLSPSPPDRTVVHTSLDLVVGGGSVRLRVRDGKSIDPHQWWLGQAPDWWVPLEPGNTEATKWETIGTPVPESQEGWTEIALAAHQRLDEMLEGLRQRYSGQQGVAARNTTRRHVPTEQRDSEDVTALFHFLYGRSGEPLFRTIRLRLERLCEKIGLDLPAK
jgi:hypothetical protein